MDEDLKYCMESHRVSGDEGLILKSWREKQIFYFDFVNNRTTNQIQKGRNVEMWSNKGVYITCHVSNPVLPSKKDGSYKKSDYKVLCKCVYRIHLKIVELATQQKIRIIDYATDTYHLWFINKQLTYSPYSRISKY